MTKSHTTLASAIEKGVNAITKGTAFTQWISGEASTGEGVVAINNSFVYRDLVKTTKNGQYLCVSVKDGKVVSDSPSAAKPQAFNNDFKFFKSASKVMPETQALETAVDAEIAALGQLVFVLVGEIEDVVCEVEIDHAYAHILRFDPKQKDAARLIAINHENKVMAVNELIDPEAAWNEIAATVEKEIGKETEGFQAAFSTAFDRLQQQAQSRLILPSSGAPQSQSSFLSRVRSSVKEQRRLYEDGLRKTSRAKTNQASHLNEVLRIAYNFADDAINVLALLISVCDLKGIVSWCTLPQHFALAETFRGLPWTKIKGKPSLKRYQEVVNGARNRAFHNLLGFDRSLFSDLTGIDVKARSLTLLPAHARRKGHVAFDYEDRELVEVLSQLTLAPETAVSMEFWRRNADVMAKFEDLLDATENALWLLNAARATIGNGKR